MLVWEEEASPSASHTTSIAPNLSSEARAMPLSPQHSVSSAAHVQPQLQSVHTSTPPAGVASHSSAQASTARRVNVADKRIINGQTDVNQLVPFKYKWAWENLRDRRPDLRSLSVMPRTRTGPMPDLFAAFITTRSPGTSRSDREPALRVSTARPTCACECTCECTRKCTRK